MKTILIAALLLISLFAFALYGIDKAKAKRGAWRIPEATLLLVAFLGGSFGALLGMEVFRHKTKHWQFWPYTWSSAGCCPEKRLKNPQKRP